MKKFLLIVGAICTLCFLFVGCSNSTKKPIIVESEGYRYNLILWEFKNLPDKIIHKIKTKNNTDTFYETLVWELVEISKKIRKEQEIKNQTDPQEVSLKQLIIKRNNIRDEVEEYLESLLSQEIKNQKLSIFGGLIWPPVDFRIDNPPKLLVVSPRSEIVRVNETLINPDIEIHQMEVIENNLEKKHNLSGLVIQTGGLASYPTVVPSDVDLRELLEIAAHEWLHAYLIFQPLGRGYFKGGEMVTINESLADMFGRELGGRVYSNLLGVPFEEPERPVFFEATEEKLAGFDFNNHLRETRLEVESLLSDGLVFEAENYMEKRKNEINSNGYNIRKINQAYFAFHGSYGSSPSSISPVANYLWDLREQSKTIGELIHIMEDVSDYEEFEQILLNRGLTVFYNN